MVFQDKAMVFLGKTMVFMDISVYEKRQAAAQHHEASPDEQLSGLAFKAEPKLGFVSGVVCFFCLKFLFFFGVVGFLCFFWGEGGG